MKHRYTAECPKLISCLVGVASLLISRRSTSPAGQRTSPRPLVVENFFSPVNFPRVVPCRIENVTDNGVLISR